MCTPLKENSKSHISIQAEIGKLKKTIIRKIYQFNVIGTVNKQRHLCQRIPTIPRMQHILFQVWKWPEHTNYMLSTAVQHSNFRYFVSV